MIPVQIYTTVDRTSALRAGRTHFGTVAGKPTREELAFLTPAERERLATFTEGKPLDLSDFAADPLWPDTTITPPWAIVVAALRTLLTVEADEKAREAAAREAAIQKWLASATVDHLVDKVRHDSWRWHVYASKVVFIDNRSVEYSDPRVQARLVTLEAEAARRTARDREEAIVAMVALGAEKIEASKVSDRALTELQPDPRIDALLAEREVVRARRKAEAAAAAERYAEICRACVREFVPDYARAAAEGANVNRRAEQYAIATLKARVEAVRGPSRADAHLDAPMLTIVSTCGDDSAQPAPHKFAYEVLDAVRAALSKSELPGPIARVETSIVRADMCPEKECRAGYRTCVCVDLHWKDGDTTDFHVYADKAAPHVHADDADDGEE